MTPEVTVFLERMLEEGGMVDLEPGVKQQMLDDLGLRLQNAIFVALLERLPENDLPAFNTLVEEKAPQEQIQQFLTARIPNLEEVTAQAMLDFRRLYVSETAVA